MKPFLFIQNIVNDIDKIVPNFASNFKKLINKEEQTDLIGGGKSKSKRSSKKKDRKSKYKSLTKDQIKNIKQMRALQQFQTLQHQINILYRSGYNVGHWQMLLDNTIKRTNNNKVVAKLNELDTNINVSAINTSPPGTPTPSNNGRQLTSVVNNSGLAQPATRQLPQPVGNNQTNNVINILINFLAHFYHKKNPQPEIQHINYLFTNLPKIADVKTNIDNLFTPPINAINNVFEPNDIIKAKKIEPITNLFTNNNNPLENINKILSLI